MEWICSWPGGFISEKYVGTPCEWLVGVLFTTVRWLPRWNEYFGNVLWICMCMCTWPFVGLLPRVHMYKK